MAACGRVDYALGRARSWVEVFGVLLDGLVADCCCWITEKKRISS